MTAASKGGRRLSLYGETCNALLGPCIHTWAATDQGGAERAEAPPLYLTFDDGPMAGCTDRVLDTLAALGARASFFVVAEHASRQTKLVRRALAEGHTIGNHSLDHDFRAFFRSKDEILRWVRRAQLVLEDLLGIEPVGFRSPAGVRTPPLHWALAQLEIPLIHWNVRFFDRAWRWREERAVSSLAKTEPGSIVLLHDCHTGLRADDFLATLRAYVTAARRQGFDLRALPKRIPRASSVRVVHSSGR